MKNLQLTLILIISLFSGNVFSQDIISLKNGEEIMSKVTEVGEKEIKYKKFSNINGPSYSLNIVDVFMIKYENGEQRRFDDLSRNELTGTKIDEDGYMKVDFTIFGAIYYEGDKKISKKEFISKIENYPVVYNQYNLGKNLLTVGNVIGIPAGLVFGYNIGAWLGGEQPNRAVLAVSGICTGGAMALAYIGGSKIKDSIDSYNVSEKFGLNLNINENGIGLALRF